MHLRVASLRLAHTSFNNASGPKMPSLQKRRYSRPLTIRVSASKRIKTFICSLTRSKTRLLVQQLSLQNARKPLREKLPKGLAKVMLKSRFSWKTQFSMYSTKRIKLIHTCFRIIKKPRAGPILSNTMYPPNLRSLKAIFNNIYMMKRLNIAPSPL